MILTDAGPLTALQDRKDQYHAQCVKMLPSLQGPLITTMPAFTEAMYMLGEALSWTGQNKLWRLVWSGGLIIAELSEQVLRRASDLMDKYSDLPMDFADATLMAYAESANLSRVFTLEPDFHIYRLHGKHAFEVVP